MDFKCVQHFVLVCCACSNHLFQFLANMAAIMSVCRFFWRQNGNVDFIGSKMEKSIRDCRNLLGDVLMRGIVSDDLPEHIKQYSWSLFSFPILHL